MRNIKQRWLGLLILFLCISGFAQPPVPSQFFEFPTNFDTFFGGSPLGYTNITSVPVWAGSALIVETTNLVPAYLNYNVQDTVPSTRRNINYGSGTVLFYYAPDWASVSQGGTGPGEKAYFIGGGDWSSGSPNGLFTIYADAGGSNIWFGGVGAGVASTYASTPISWSSNTFHQIGVEWTTGDCEIYLDGTLAATGGGVGVVPTHGTWTNGFFVGSDNNGYEQARGAFWEMTTWSEEYGGLYTNGWLDISNTIVAWQGTLGGGFGGMMGIGFFGGGGFGTGTLTSDGSSGGCVTGTDPYITNMTAMPDTNGDGGTTFVFALEGGITGTNYDVFATTNLIGTNIANTIWLWLGQGTNCGTYAVTNQPTNQQFYVLGTPDMALDGSGLTVAYEALVHTSSSDGYNTPNAWYLNQGLNPQTSGIGSQDPDGDGLPNYQEYLYGTNPQVSEGFAVWIAEPGGTSGIP